MEPWKRVTTAVYREGDGDYVENELESRDEQGLREWNKARPWCGQVVFVSKLS